MTYGNPPSDPSQGGQGPYGSGPYGAGPAQPAGQSAGGQQPYGQQQPPQYGSQQYGSQPGEQQQPPPYGSQPGSQQPYGSPQYGAQPYGSPQGGSPYGAPQQGGAPYGAPQGGAYGAAPMAAGSITTTVPGGPQQMGPGGEPALSQPLYGATFMQATKRFFKKYARFSGYASLSEHWWAYLAMALISLVAAIPFIIGYVMVIASAATMDPYATSMPTGVGAGGVIIAIGGILLLLVTLALLVPTLALQARRLHDAGFSALFLLLYLVPSVGSLIVLVFMFLPTKVEARKPEWDDPKGD